MKRFLCALTAAVLFLSMFAQAFALETRFFTIEHETTAYDTIMELNDGGVIILYPLSNLNDTLSSVNITWASTPSNVSSWTQDNIESQAKLVGMSIEALKDGVSVFSNSQVLDAGSIVLDGVDTIYFTIKCLWTSASDPSAHMDMYSKQYMMDINGGTLCFACTAIDEFSLAYLGYVVETIKWKENTSSVIPNLSNNNNAAVSGMFDYGDFHMPYTPGPTDIAGNKSTGGFLYTLYPFVTSGDYTTAIMIVWQGGISSSELYAMSRELSTSLSSTLVDGFLTGMKSSGVVFSSYSITDSEVFDMDGNNALRIQIKGTVDFSSIGVDLQREMFLSYYFIPTPDYSGVYSFVTLSDQLPKLEQAQALIEAVEWD